MKHIRYVGIAALLLVIFSVVVLDWSSTTRISQYAGHRQYLRVVALAPSMSETMMALDQAHRLVGVTIHCNAPSLANVPKIGSFAEPNFEAILAQNPDLVLAVPHVMAKVVVERLRQNNIEVFAHQPDSLKDIKFIIEALALKLGLEQKGQEVVLGIDKAIRRARNDVAHLEIPGKPKTALIAVSHLPFVVAGKHTFPSEILEQLGLLNMADDGKSSWPVWPLEKLISDPPQILVLANGQDNWRRYEELFLSMGIDLFSPRMRLIVPKRPLFSSPSPLIIEDAAYLSSLLRSDA